MCAATFLKSDLANFRVSQFRDFADTLDNPQPTQPDLSSIGAWATAPEQGAGGELAPSPLPTAPVSPPPEPGPSVAPAPAPPIYEVGSGVAGQPIVASTGRPATRTSQFGLGLSNSDAYAACGPAAAIAFAATYGRNPTAQEALALAKQVGWTPNQGMAGVQSEQALLSKLGVATKLEQGVDWQHVAADAQAGNPVILDTPGHYYYVDSYKDGKYHVGTSGTDLRGGSEWMTAAQIDAHPVSAGRVRAALYADSPLSRTPSVVAGSSPAYSDPVASPGVATAQPRPAAQLQTAPDITGATPAAAPAEVAPAPSSPLDAFRAFADTLDRGKEAIGQAAGSAVDQFRSFADSLDKSAEAVPAPGMGFDPSHMQVATPPAEGIPPVQDVRDLGQQPQPTIFENIGQAVAENQANPPLASLGQALAESPVGQAYQSDIRRQLLPNITEPEHPFNIMADLREKYGTSLPSDRMTPEDQERARNAALFVGGMAAPFGPAGKAATRTVEAEVERLRLDKFPEWLRPTIQEGAEKVGFAVEQRRGVIPDVQSEQMADELGRTVEQWIKGGKAGKLYNAEESRALRNVVTTQAQRVDDISRQVVEATTRGEATDKLIAQAAAEGDKLQSLITVMEGNRAEWGRAGHAWQASTRLLEAQPGEAISEIYKAFGGRENALEAVAQYRQLVDSGANPIQMAKFWAHVKNPPAGVEDWYRALRYNSMLSGPRTIEINTIGNGLEVPWRLARDIGASVIRGRPEEIAPELAGMVGGLHKANRAFMETLSTGVTTEQALAGDLPHTLASRVSGPVAKAAATGLEVPGRILQAADQWARAIAYGMAQGRRAGVTANKEGLRGQAWSVRVAELMADPTFAAKEASAIADRMTYKGDMGALGSALGQVQRVPFLGNAILPFLRTIYHITARGIDRSPFGIVGTIADVARGKYGGSLKQVGQALGESVGPGKGVAPLGERLGDNLIGSAAWLAFYNQALAGNISGAGPDDREKRDMLRAQGWQPYSVKVGDHWVSYANWGPVAIPLDAAAAAAEAQTFRKPGADVGAIIADGMRRSTQLMTEQTYLQGIGVIWKALSEPERFGSQAIGQFMTSLVPFGSALNTAAQAGDVYQRQPGRENLGQYIGQSIENRLPGLRQNVPIAQDQLGRPVPNPSAGAVALSPLRASTITNNAVLQEMLANGADVPEPPKSFRNIPLTPDEQRVFNEAAGRYTEQVVMSLMKDKGYQRLAPENKQKALQRAVENARNKAGAEFVQTIGLTEAQRRLGVERGRKVPVGIVP